MAGGGPAEAEHGSVSEDGGALFDTPRSWERFTPATGRPSAASSSEFLLNWSNRVVEREVRPKAFNRSPSGESVDTLLTDAVLAANDHRPCGNHDSSAGARRREGVQSRRSCQPSSRNFQGGGRVHSGGAEGRPTGIRDSPGGGDTRRGSQRYSRSSVAGIWPGRKSSRGRSAMALQAR